MLTNTTDCSTVCENQINLNGDLEQEGTATNFNLSFQSTPALLIQKNITPTSWFERYGGSVTSTTAFNGAFYLKRQEQQATPTVAPHGVYEGFWYLFIVLGYPTLIWIVARHINSVFGWRHTNSTTQIASPFALEHSSSDGTNTYAPAIQLVAPASTSWNNLNWQRYDFILRYQVMATNGVILFYKW